MKKLLVGTKLNLVGKTLICTTSKFGNFTKNKEYPVSVYGRHLDGTPGNFRITDDDHDYYTIRDTDIGRIFEVL